MSMCYKVCDGVTVVAGFYRVLSECAGRLGFMHVNQLHRGTRYDADEVERLASGDAK